ncbi:Dabb family protein [Spongiactinospora sp. TRM90649]|uniref:Dabb family protein n=1 Tax=Spongiactinospora sp. TRM90649 TaxID=3031114 RepID=UPI0023F89B6A|nr:Dabb family protein [Spongiactinospora sp. TRM90649]MDF5754431.1 Dabb family protein [Spongiactinospora sp. TRM90649]
MVLLNWSDEATDTQITEIATRLRGLTEVIPEIQAYHCGPDAGINSGNHDFAIVADFATADDYAVYRDHPAHREIITGLIAPIAAGRAAAQFHL